MPVNRNEAGQFTKGQSGNPSGRRKIPEEIKAALKSYEPEAIRVLGELLHSKKEIIRFKAAQEILDRTQGKPESMSKVELSTSEDNKIIFKWISEEKPSDEKGP